MRGDLERFFARLVQDGDPLFRHRDESDEDMHAHVQAAPTAVRLTVPIVEGRLALGTWERVYLWEHRVKGHLHEVCACSGRTTLALRFLANILIKVNRSRMRKKASTKSEVVFAALPAGHHRQLSGSSVSKFCQPVSGHSWRPASCPKRSCGVMTSLLESRHPVLYEAVVQLSSQRRYPMVDSASEIRDTSLHGEV